MIYFLDDHGTRHAGAISEKYPEIRDTRTAGAARFSEFAIQHAGFVVLREVPSGLTVSWSPSIISNSGLAALLYAVSDMDHVPLILRSWRGSQWTTEVCQPNQSNAWRASLKSMPRIAANLANSSPRGSCHRMHSRSMRASMISSHTGALGKASPAAISTTTI